MENKIIDSGGWIGVDLDGTLAKYEGWKSPYHIGEPIPKMVKRVQDWLDRGQEVRIFTARVYDPSTKADVEKAIKDWCWEHIGERIPATNQKDYSMIELWDDRCVQVESNTGRVIRDGYIES